MRVVPPVKSTEDIVLAGFDLARDQGGIRGLSVVLNDGSISDWVGDFDNLPTRRLEVPKGAQVDATRYLRGGFDVRNTH